MTKALYGGGNAAVLPPMDEGNSLGIGERLDLLIPGLKALVARHTGLAAWNNLRPLQMSLSGENAEMLFVACDACGLELAEAA
jgi:hypothetical protein